MDLIEAVFAHLGSWVHDVMPEGAVRDLISRASLAASPGSVVFLPQICLLFFLISILEDTGYLARAAFVMDRLLCRFGLPGHAFVPLLSAHACALPGIMSARLIPDRRDRLATILVAPLMSCSARLPVYVLPDRACCSSIARCSRRSRSPACYLARRDRRAAERVRHPADAGQGHGAADGAGASEL